MQPRTVAASLGESPSQLTSASNSRSAGLSAANASANASRSATRSAMPAPGAGSATASSGTSGPSGVRRPARAALVGDHLAGDAEQPGQRLIGHRVESPPGDQEGLRDSFLGGGPIVATTDREAKHPRITGAEDRFKLPCPARLETEALFLPPERNCPRPARSFIAGQFFEHPSITPEYSDVRPGVVRGQAPGSSIRCFGLRYSASRVSRIVALPLPLAELCGSWVVTMPTERSCALR